MSKAILFSVPPEQCCNIANGKQTVFVQRRKPKLKAPFKAYIYCPMARKPIKDGKTIVYYKDDLAITNRWGRGRLIANPLGTLGKDEMLINGKVIGEFVCDKVYFKNFHLRNVSTITLEELSELTCLSVDDLTKYADGKNLYGFNITNLVIYETPKDISEFKQCHKCEYYEGCYEHEYSCDGTYNLINPPRSWGYVEELR